MENGGRVGGRYRILFAMGCLATYSCCYGKLDDLVVAMGRLATYLLRDH